MCVLTRLALHVLVQSPTSPKGTMRCTSVQEVAAPPSVVWHLLTDFPNYPKFVKGISQCRPYAKRRTITGGKVVCARYSVSVGPAFRVHYYLEHQYEPLHNCMVWQLDYSKRSDVRTMSLSSPYLGGDVLPPLSLSPDLTALRLSPHRSLTLSAIGTSSHAAQTSAACTTPRTRCCPRGSRRRCARPSRRSP